MLRCPLCAGLDHAELYGQLLRCKLCSLGFARGAHSFPLLDTYQVSAHEFIFCSWNNVFSRVTRRLPAGSQLPFYFSSPTVRMFAAREGRHATSIQSSLPFVPGFAPWSFGRTLCARIEMLPESKRQEPDPRLTLGVIATPTASKEVLDLCIDVVEHVAEVIVALDTFDTATAATLEAALCRALNEAGKMRPRVIAHPLEANFAAQRNRIQQAASTEWILQLDCDERLSAGAKNNLSCIVDDAEREGWDAVAMTRRNVVDGLVSALYPDVQYRLLRRSVRFTRAVHEYPLLGRRQRSFVHLGAGIIHNIAGPRLKQREVLYEGLQNGAGRPHDTALLNMLLESTIRLPE